MISPDHHHFLHQHHQQEEISGDFWPEPEEWSCSAWGHWLCGEAG